MEVPLGGTEGRRAAVGRAAELAAVHTFVHAEGAGTLDLVGGAGIGKTTLWEAGLAEARARGLTVLAAHPSDAEAQLAFAALTDLFDDVDDARLADVPAPQRRALDVALLRAEAAGSPPDPRAIAAGVRGALAALASRGPVLVAIDDVQWLDTPSSDALTFAARRLGGEAVRFLLARRTGPTPPLVGALERQGLERLELGPLSIGAIRRLLADRLGLSLPRHGLRRLVEATLGNPLFALEVGRLLASGGPSSFGRDLPVPETIEELLGTRVSRLPEPLRRSLLAVALSAELLPSELARITSTAPLEEAVDAGLLVVDGDRARPSHPLLAEAAKRGSSAAERRRLHGELARVVGDEELRALHLALATTQPDEALAASVADAAARAAARGARHAAVELSEHALRLTPADSGERSDRVLALAGALERTGRLREVTELLTPELETLPPGGARVRAWLLLAEGGEVRTLPELERHLDAALAECRDDMALRAHVLVKKADHAAASAVTRLGKAEAWAAEALDDVPRGSEVERLALLALAWARALRGRPIDDLCARFAAVSDEAASLADTPERVAGQRSVWRGEVAEARTAITGMLARADEVGEPLGYALQRLHLCELELRVGAWAAAEHLLDEWAESSEGELLIWPMYERCRALLEAGRGLPVEARRWSAETLRRAEASGGVWDRLEGGRAVGITALLAREPDLAAEHLRAVWAHTEREGVDEPGVFPVAPDLVEALLELGEPDEARDVASRLRELATAQAHPWGLATARRCGALVRLHAAYAEDAAAQLLDAAAAYDTLGLRFDHARSLHALGRAQRRHRKWGAARASLERAAAAFEALGSPGWAEAARSELARVGARRPRAAGGLTAAERRVVELAVDGLSNKEIARALVVAVPTVEGHLSRAYAKLGVRSRGQLAARLAER